MLETKKPQSPKTTSTMNVANMANSKNPFLHPEIIKPHIDIFCKVSNPLFFPEFSYEKNTLNFNEKQSPIASSKWTLPFPVKPRNSNHQQDSLFASKVRKFPQHQVNNRLNLTAQTKLPLCHIQAEPLLNPQPFVLNTALSIQKNSTLAQKSQLVTPNSTSSQSNHSKFSISSSAPKQQQLSQLIASYCSFHKSLNYDRKFKHVLLQYNSNTQITNSSYANLLLFKLFNNSHKFILAEALKIPETNLNSHINFMSYYIEDEGGGIMFEGAAFGL